MAYSFVQTFLVDELQFFFLVRRDEGSVSLLINSKI